MIVIYINGEGMAEKLSPQHVYQGSNQTGVTVFAPVPTTTAIGIAFRLPDGSSTTYYPMTYIQSVEGLSQYEFTVPSSITQKAGQASIALRAVYSDGQQTSQLVEFEIEPSVLPTLPDDIDQSAYDVIMQYLQQDRSDITAIQGQINDLEETVDSAEKSATEAVKTANQAKETADGLAESIAQANATAQEAVETANGAVNNIEQYKKETDNEIESFKNTVNGQIADIESTANSAVNIANDAKSTADGLTSSIAQANTTANEAKEIAEEALEQSKVTGTKVNIAGAFATEVNFDSDPQGQIDGKVSKSGDTMTGPLHITGEEKSWSMKADHDIGGAHVYEGETRVYSPNNLPSRTSILDTRDNNITDQTTFPSRTVTPFFSHKDMPSTDWWSGFYVRGWDNDANDKYWAWLLAGYSGNGVGSDMLWHRQINPRTGEMTGWKALLELDPTKLEPTTANGWTIGGNDLIIDSDGVYLISVNNDSSSDMAIYGSNPSIMIVRGAPLPLIGTTYAGITLVRRNSSTIAYNQIVNYNYTVGARAQWTALNIRKDSVPTEATIGQVAYKKLA